MPPHQPNNNQQTGLQLNLVQRIYLNGNSRLLTTSKILALSSTNHLIHHSKEILPKPSGMSTKINLVIKVFHSKSAASQASKIKILVSVFMLDLTIHIQNSTNSLTQSLNN